MIELAVGQKLWFVPSHKRDSPHEVIVEKIGRKWAHVSQGHRIYLEDLVADGGNYSSPGRCWLSQDAWDAEKLRRTTWEEFRRYVDVHYRIPDGLSVDEVCQALAMIQPKGPKP